MTILFGVGLLLLVGFSGCNSEVTPTTSQPRPPLPPPAPIPPSTQVSETPPTSSDQPAPPVTTPAAVLSTWSVRPDPPNAPIPALIGDLQIPAPISPTVVLPRQHAPFAAICIAGQERRVESFDLRTGERLGNVPLQDAYVRVSHGKGTELSPDGRYIACPFSSPRQLRVCIWSIANGTQQTFDLAAGVTEVSAIRFSRADRLVAVYDDAGGGVRFATYDPATGRMVDEFKDAEVRLADFDLGSIQTTPGGKFLAAVSTTLGRVRFWNLERRTVAGQLEIQFPPESRPQAAFSPDGSRLAVVSTTEHKPGYHAAVVDLRSGVVAYQAEYGDDISAPQSEALPPLDWSIDQRYIVVSQQDVLEAATGRKVALLKFNEGYARRGNLRIVGSDRMLLLSSVEHEPVLRLTDLNTGWTTAPNSHE
jgi:WD40 repeat protein